MKSFNSQAEAHTERSHRRAFRDIPRTEIVGNDRSEILVRRGLREYLSRSRKLRGAPLPTIEGLEARSIEWTAAERANRHASRFARRKKKEHVRQWSHSIHKIKQPEQPGPAIETAASDDSLASLGSERSAAQIVRFTDNLASLIRAERDRQATNAKLRDAEEAYLIEEQRLIQAQGDTKHIVNKKSHAGQNGDQNVVLECEGHERRLAQDLVSTTAKQKALLKDMNCLEKQLNKVLETMSAGERHLFTAARGFLRNLILFDPEETTAPLRFRYAIRWVSDAARSLLLSRAQDGASTHRPAHAPLVVVVNGDVTVDPAHRGWINSRTYRTLLERFYRTVEPTMEEVGMITPRETSPNQDQESSKSDTEQQRKKTEVLHDLEKALKELDDASNYLESDLPATYSSRQRQHFSTYDYERPAGGAGHGNSFDKIYLEDVKAAAENVRVKTVAVFEARNRLMENKTKDPYASAKDLLGVRDELLVCGMIQWMASQPAKTPSFKEIASLVR